MEKINGVKTGKLYAGQDDSKVYFADYNSVSSLDKKTLKYAVDSKNEFYSKAPIIKAIRSKNGKMYIVELNSNNEALIYQFDKNAKQKTYISNNLRRNIRFFESKNSNNIFFFEGNYNSTLYKINVEDNKVLPITSTSFSFKNAELPIVQMPDGTMIIAGGHGKQIFLLFVGK